MIELVDNTVACVACEREPSTCEVSYGALRMYWHCAHQHVDHGVAVAGSPDASCDCPREDIYRALASTTVEPSEDN